MNECTHFANVHQLFLIGLKESFASLGLQGVGVLWFSSFMSDAHASSVVAMDIVGVAQEGARAGVRKEQSQNGA